MTRNHHARLKLWLAAAGVLLIGSMGFSRGVADENIGQVRQGLVGGTEVDERTQEIYGLLTLSGSCSASLLRNNWAISAAHCVDATDARGNTMRDPNRPGQNVLDPISGIRVRAAWGGTAAKKGQTKRAIRVETFWPYDIAIIQLDSPFEVNGKTTGYVREVFFDQFPYFGTPVTVPITVFGRGVNQFAFGSGNNAVPSQSDGKYRMGKARVAKEERNGTLYWYPSEGGQMIAGGDSGGPSFATVGTSQTTVLVGVHALANTKRVPGKVEDPAKPWEWVTATPEAADAPIRPVWKQIEAIMGPLPKAPDPDNPTPVFTYTTPIGNVNASSEYNTIYGIQQDGMLMWQRHLISRNGNTVRHSWNTPKRVGDGWLAGYAGAYPAGQNAIYTMADNGELRWHWHTGVLDGSYRWREPSHVVGTGWTMFRQIIPMDKGVVYGILPDGTLRWQKHTDYQNGTAGVGGWTDARIVGWGWDPSLKFFSGGNGIIYGVEKDGTLMWRKHKEYLNPPAVPSGDASNAVKLKWQHSWGDAKKVGDGWGDFTHLFSPGEGHIYGVRPNGDLEYHRHLGWANGTYTWDDKVNGKIAEGWNAYPRVFARINTSDAGSGNPEVDFIQPK